MTRYPLIEETVSVHAKLIARFGGSGGIRDRGALESALARPRSGYYSDVIQEAAALWESLSQNHPFVDGNKRLAVTMTGAFLRVNGYRLEFDDTEALSFLLDLYDALERLTEKTYSGSTTSKATLFYDTCDKGLGLLCGGAAYDPANTATVIGSFGYGYDDNGRIVSSTQTTNGAAYQFGYTYNAAGTPETITYPAMSGRVVTYCYDKGGRPKDVINGTVSGSSKYATDITYAENGGLASMKSNNVGTVWTQTAWTYDPSRQRPSAINISRNGSTLLKLEYFFCPSLGQSCTVNNGNLVSARITRGSTIWNQSYGYDSFNRLKTGTETALPGLTGWSLTYVHDRYGNRGVLSSSIPEPDGVFVPRIATDSAASVEAVYPTSNRWNGATYNNSGDVTGYGGSTYGYDGEHRIRTVSTPGQPAVTYAYDALGRRMWKDVGGARTVFVYDAFGRLALEVGGTGQVGTSYLFQDMLGSTRLITDKNGNELRRIDYYPFGREIPQGMNGRTGTLWSMAGYPAAPDLASQKFTGKERDAETGLDYFGARYMSVAQGRFTSPDRPLVDQIPSDPQSWNLYSYVRNNPLRRNDPSGLKCVDLDGGGQGDDGLPGKACGKEAGLDLTHGTTVNGRGESAGVQVFGNAFLRGDLQSGRMDSSDSDLLIALAAARGAMSLGRGLGRQATQDVLIQGPYGSISRAALEAAANSGGSTIRVVTRLTQAPQVGRALSTAAGEGAEALAAAAQAGGQTYAANIPTALISVMKQAGLVLESTTSMGGAVATELRFLPQASEFIVKFFH